MGLNSLALFCGCDKMTNV